MAGVTNTFVAGTDAVAAQVNQNFGDCFRLVGSNLVTGAGSTVDQDSSAGGKYIGSTYFAPGSALNKILIICGLDEEYVIDASGNNVSRGTIYTNEINICLKIGERGTAVTALTPVLNYGSPIGTSYGYQEWEVMIGSHYLEPLWSAPGSAYKTSGYTLARQNKSTLFYVHTLTAGEISNGAAVVLWGSATAEIGDAQLWLRNMYVFNI
jgi:hypothetical protein